MNKVILCGNLTKDPYVRYTQSGKATARMPSAIKSYGEILAADFLTLWRGRKPPNASGKYLAKSSKVLVEGRLKNNNYKENKGVMHYNVDVIVTSAFFMDAKKKSGDKADEGYPTDDERSPDDDDMPF